MSKPRYRIELEPSEGTGQPVTPPARRLAQAVKQLLRRHGFDCKLAVELNADGSAKTLEQSMAEEARAEKERRKPVAHQAPPLL